MRIRSWTPILYDIAEALASVRDPEARVDRVLTLLKSCVPFDRCMLLEATPLLSRPITIIPRPAIAETSTMLMGRLNHLLALLVEDAPADGPTEGRPRPKNANAHLAVPIFRLGETTGLLYVERRDAAYDETHLAFLSIVGAQLGAYLTALKADQEQSALLERRGRDVEVLQVLVAELSNNLRNSLTTISMMAEALGREEAEHQRGPLRSIGTSAAQMVHIVDHLIGLSHARIADKD